MNGQNTTHDAPNTLNHDRSVEIKSSTAFETPYNQCARSLHQQIRVQRAAASCSTEGPRRRLPLARGKSQNTTRNNVITISASVLHPQVHV